MAPLIANFYKEPRLVWIIRIMTLNLILIPLRGINRIQLVKELVSTKLQKLKSLPALDLELLPFFLLIWALVSGAW